MMNTWKQNLDETKQRYVKWWNHEGIIVNMWEHFQTGVKPHADIPMPEEPVSLQQRWLDPAWRSRYLDWYVAHSSLMADMLPVANTQLGPGSLAAILGSRLEAGEDTIWIHPHDHFDPAIPFDPEHPNYLLHKQLLQACKQRSQGHYYVGMPDLMEGLDVLAALKGTDQVLMDTVTQPEVVEQQMQRINDIYFRVFDELYDIIREGDEMCFCYFSSWAPGKMTKLQSDISTMISTDDYRRFVQPFIREQCQHIPYTLYHLDGVGAMHHLPALLEITELNAIQWTPGVGQPQGGSPQWFDLYRRILDAGKSVMACWVTLDELPKLLDSIGTEGVHLEMDFHNEQEVEQALDIVERHRACSFVPLCNPSLEQAAADRMLILDGGMGTMVQQYHLSEEDFRGTEFADSTVQLTGCNDLLTITRPDIISDIHRKYLQAGANIIETCTFNAQRISLADYGMERHVRDINLAACRVAREAATAYQSAGTPRFVLGSVGPTNRICSMPTGSEAPLDVQELREAYREQMLALLDGGVDGLLIETIFDTLNAQAAIEAAGEAMDERQRRVPVLLSFAVCTPDGHNMLGQKITDFIETLSTPIFSVGINCLSDVGVMIPLVRTLAERFPYRVSLYPNAGMPDGEGRYLKTADSLLADVWPLIDGHQLNILGGCCGTNDSHIAAFALATQPARGLFISPHRPGAGRPQATSLKKTAEAETSINDHSETAIDENPLFAAIKQGDADAACKATRNALAQGATADSLINGQMVRAMTALGEEFERGRVFVPQLLMAGKAMKEALEVIKQQSDDTKVKPLGRVLIGTVKGDLHDIGKNLVASMLEGCGFEVVNIGIDVSVDAFVDEIRKNRPDILCMSALLTTTMGYMREVIARLKEAGLRDGLKIMVGGAPVTKEFADEIGADGYSANANEAVQVARTLLCM